MVTLCISTTRTGIVYKSSSNKKEKKINIEGKQKGISRSTRVPKGMFFEQCRKSLSNQFHITSSIIYLINHCTQEGRLAEKSIQDYSLISSIKEVKSKRNSFQADHN